MKEALVYRNAQLLRLLDAQPHELRAWLRMEPIASRTKRRRAATEYSPMDVLFLMVIKKLDHAGFAPKALQTFSVNIYKALQRPNTDALTADVLVLHQRDDGLWKTGTAPEGSWAIELKIPLQPPRLELLRYTGAYMITGQTEMGFLATVQAQGPSARVSPSSSRRRTR